MRTVDGTNGRVYEVDEAGKVVNRWFDYQEYEGPSCSLCDALGHGYPGGGPCPLEER